MKRSVRFAFAAADSVGSVVYLGYSAGSPLGFPATVFGVVTLLLSIYSAFPFTTRSGYLAYICSSTMLAFGSFAIGYVGAARYALYGGTQNLFVGLLGAVAGVIFILLDLIYASYSR